MAANLKVPPPLPSPLSRRSRRTRGALLALALAATVPCSRCQHSALDAARMMDLNPDCFQKGFQYDIAIPNTNTKAASLAECQAFCRKLNRCVVFAFWPFGGECWFGDARAKLVPSKTGAIAGFATCPNPTDLQATPSCSSDYPRNGFPGLSRAASNEAWLSGRQPFSLQCWPRNDTGGLLPCKHTVVLEDTEHGWPGKCRKLRKMEDGYTTCEESCKRDPTCASWQQGVFGGCWQGLGDDCYVRPGFAPLKAQRFQHGMVRVLMDLTGWQIIGLYKVFDNKDGYFPVIGDAIEACKMMCYSDIHCQYWTYAPNFGCWLEDATKEYKPPYPLTLDYAYRSTAFALDCVAGEFIQHYCPETHTTTYPASVPQQGAAEECMQKGMEYEPLDMDGTEKTKEPSVDICQVRCENSRSCAFFTYFPDGSCHLADRAASQKTSADRLSVAGSVACHLSMSVRQEACMRLGTQYDPLDMAGQSRSTEKTAALCKIRCENTPGCAFYTFWPDGGCHLEAADAAQVTSLNPKVLSASLACHKGLAGQLVPYVPTGMQRDARTGQFTRIAAADCNGLCRWWPAVAAAGGLVLLTSVAGGIFLYRRHHAAPKAMRRLKQFDNEDELHEDRNLWQTQVPLDGLATRVQSAVESAFHTQPPEGYVRPASKGEFTV